MESQIQDITKSDKFKKKGKKKNLFSLTNPSNNPLEQATPIDTSDKTKTLVKEETEKILEGTETKQVEPLQEEPVELVVEESGEPVEEEIGEPLEEEIVEPVEEEIVEPVEEEIVEPVEEEIVEPVQQQEQGQEQKQEDTKMIQPNPVEPPVFKIAKTKSKLQTLKEKQKSSGIYTTNIITRRINLKINYVGQNLKQNLEEKIKNEIEGRCIIEGYIKPDSCKILTFSSGLIKGEYVQFEVSIECLICNPVEGIIINCIAENVTKAGIRAVLQSENSPLIVFIARDHYHLDDYFNTITEGMEIKIKVVGQRYELNDKYISVIGELVQQSFGSKKRNTSKPKLIIE